MKKLLRPIITLITVLVIAFIVIYPKVKDKLFVKKEPVAAQAAARGGSGGPASQGPGVGGPPSAGGGGMRGGQILNVSGVVIAPSTVTEFINSTGSLIPDEEVELSFETSGKIVNIFFT